jgi:hypothetical protein
MTDELRDLALRVIEKRGGPVSEFGEALDALKEYFKPQPPTVSDLERVYKHHGAAGVAGHLLDCLISEGCESGREGTHGLAVEWELVYRNKTDISLPPKSGALR